MGLQSRGIYGVGFATTPAGGRQPTVLGVEGKFTQGRIVVCGPTTVHVTTRHNVVGRVMDLQLYCFYAHHGYGFVGRKGPVVGVHTTVITVRRYGVNANEDYSSVCFLIRVFGQLFGRCR